MPNAIEDLNIDSKTHLVRSPSIIDFTDTTVLGLPIPTALVSTVFGRTGDVVAQAGDYAAFYPQLDTAYADPSWISSLAWSKITGAPPTAPVTSVFGRAGDITAQSADYSAFYQPLGSYEVPLTFSQSLTRSTNTVHLVNDVADPTTGVDAGTNRFYGINTSNVRGFYQMPAFVAKTGDTMTGPLLVPEGTSSANGLQVGAANTGLNVSTGNLRLTVGGSPRLTISGTTITGGTGAKFQLPSGTAAAPTYSFTGEPDGGLYVSWTDAISMAAGGVEIMRWSPTGITAYKPLAGDGSGLTNVPWTSITGAPAFEVPLLFAGSLLRSVNTIRLVNDLPDITSPTNANLYYGTDASGARGFYALPASSVTSVFGRTGAVVAAANDYTFAQIGSKPTTLSGYGITDAQPLDTDLTAIAGLTTTSFGRGFLTQADAAASRTYIGAQVAGSYEPAFTTLSNKTLDDTNTATFKDTLFAVHDEASTTKQIKFELAGLTAQRTITPADANSITVIASIAPTSGSGPTGPRQQFMTGITNAGTIQYQLVTPNDANAETYLGNPSIDGQVLSSTVAGVRSWISPGAPAGQALTRTNDTNVTLTLGGSPNTALLAAASLTLGWTGTLAVARGGTGVSSSTGTGSVVLSASPTFTGTVTAATIDPTNITGTTTNDSATAGAVGETVSSAISAATAVQYTTNQTKNLTSISLTAGDWDVRGQITWAFSNVPANAVYTAGAGIGTTSATIADDGEQSYACLTALQATASSGYSTATLASRRISLAATATVYLVGDAPPFASGQCAGFGFIEARRVR